MSNLLVTDLLIYESVIKAVFYFCYIDCESEFYWVPAYDKWIGYFKTKFRYLYINEQYDFPNTDRFMMNLDKFVSLIEKIRDNFLNEYNYYFNELWC